MPRTAIYSALILKSRISGESNRELQILTAEEGIIRAVVYGGPKSKLRAYTSPFNSGRLWVYHNPIKKSSKVSDFDVHSWRPGLRELYDRTMAAGAVAETILATHGGGGAWEQALTLAVSALNALENATEDLCERLLIQFLWRWAGLLGIQPFFENCSSCEKETAAVPVWYSESGVLCENCRKPGLLRIDPGSRRWLSTAGGIDPMQLYRYSMDGKSQNEAKALSCAILGEVLGKKLTSWEW
jgi:DNA repair protein RecO (recombination protein O)